MSTKKVYFSASANSVLSLRKVNLDACYLVASLKYLIEWILQKYKIKTKSQFSFAPYLTSTLATQQIKALEQQWRPSALSLVQKNLSIP